MSTEPAHTVAAGTERIGEPLGIRARRTCGVGMVVYRRYLQNIRLGAIPLFVMILVVGTAAKPRPNHWFLVAIAVVLVPLGTALVARCLLMGLYLDLAEGRVYVRTFWRTRVLNVSEVTAVFVDDRVLPIGGSYCPAFFVNGKERAASCLVAGKGWATRETGEIAERLGKPVIDARSLDDRD